MRCQIPGFLQDCKIQDALFDSASIAKLNNPAKSIGKTPTLLGTNISPPKVCLKMIFLYLRWDIPWRVGWLCLDPKLRQLFDLPQQLSSIGNETWEVGVEVVEKETSKV